MKKNGRDRRQHRRVNLLYNLEVLNCDAGQHLGYLVDISFGGFMLLSRQQIDSEDELLVRISLPDEHPSEAITAKAKLCWSKTDVNPEYYASGFCFTAFSLESLKLIKKLINHYELSNSAVNLFA